MYAWTPVGHFAAKVGARKTLTKGYSGEGQTMRVFLLESALDHLNLVLSVWLAIGAP